MKHRVVIMSVIALLVASDGFAQGRGVSTPESRTAVLERARASLAERPAATAEDYRSLKDPFNPPETDLKDLVVDNSFRPKDTAPKLMSDSEVLSVLAGSITPTGAVELGGEPYLLFGEKRLKTGDRYTVTKDGVDYAVIINSIETSRYSLRYNSQVLFRQIK